jgi:FAD/FMN-containing dehydrogenase
MAIAERLRKDLALSFKGDLLGPEDRDYGEVRKLHNAMIDKRPALIARATDTQDVATAVKLAHRDGILTAIRSGGHNAGGLGSCDDGLMIDLKPMNRIEVDAGTREVRVQGGCMLKEMDWAI